MIVWCVSAGWPHATEEVSAGASQQMVVLWQGPSVDSELTKQSWTRSKTNQNGDRKRELNRIKKYLG